MNDRCPECGALYALLGGRVHRCVPRQSASSVPVNNSRVELKADSVINTKQATGAQRQAKWREKNRDTANARARAGMAKKRAAKRKG